MIFGSKMQYSFKLDKYTFWGLVFVKMSITTFLTPAHSQVCISFEKAVFMYHAELVGDDKKA